MRIGKEERAARAELLRWTFTLVGREKLLETKGLLEMALDALAHLTFAELDRACSEVAFIDPKGPVIAAICEVARARGGEEVRRREEAHDARRRARAGLKPRRNER